MEAGHSLFQRPGGVGIWGRLLVQDMIYPCTHLASTDTSFLPLSSGLLLLFPVGAAGPMPINLLILLSGLGCSFPCNPSSLRHLIMAVYPVVSFTPMLADGSQSQGKKLSVVFAVHRLQRESKIPHWLKHFRVVVLWGRFPEQFIGGPRASHNASPNQAGYSASS